MGSNNSKTSEQGAIITEYVSLLGFLALILSIAIPPVSVSIIEMLEVPGWEYDCFLEGDTIHDGWLGRNGPLVEKPTVCGQASEDSSDDLGTGDDLQNHGI